MKIAAITDDGQTISQHFGRARFYQVFTIEGTKIVDSEMRPKLGHFQFGEHYHDAEHHHDDAHGHTGEAHSKHQRMADAISDCSVVVCGGMGMGAYESMRQLGLTPIVTDLADIEAAVQAYIDGKLIDHPDYTSSLSLPKGCLTMKKIPFVDLQQILIQHQQYLSGDPAGMQARLQGVDLFGVNFASLDLRKANFRGANLKRVVFWNTNLEGADLEDADLKHAVMEGANLKGAILKHTNLKGVNLEQCDLRGCDLSRANIDSADFDGAVYDQSTRWPDHFDPGKAGAVFAE